jgi:DNA-binding SARP family transcriptional activator
VRFRVLGPVEIHTDDDRVLTLASRRERLLLGILLLTAGRLVSLDELIRLIWDEEPPASARTSSYIYIARIRQMLVATGGAAALTRQQGGYRLDVNRDAVDAHQFRRLVNQAAKTADLAGRERLLSAALALWRGRPLEDAATDEQRDRLTADLDEAHLHAVEELLAVRLELGRAREVLPDLARAAAEYPLRERLVELQMRALHQAGRSTEALSVYARARASLADELGLDPSPALQEVHRAILRSELLLPTAGDRSSRPENAFRYASHLLERFLGDRGRVEDRDRAIELFETALATGRLRSDDDEFARAALGPLLALRAAETGSSADAERGHHHLQLLVDEAPADSALRRQAQRLLESEHESEAIRAALARLSPSLQDRRAPDVGWAGSSHSNEPPDDPGPGVSGPAGAVLPSSREPDRYLVGEVPGRVRVDAELSLIVSITSESPEPGLPAAPLRGLRPGPLGTPVTVIVRPDAGLVALGELQQIITVPQRGGGSPIRFALRARTVGLARIRVTAWVGGTFLAELRLEVSVESGQPGADSQRRTAPIGELRGDPGEVTLQVNLDGSRYSFQLLSQSVMSGPVVAESLAAEPGEAVERTVAMLRRMASDASAYTPPLAARWVRETGAGLWRDLVPRSIQDQFWHLRDSITSFTIACNHDTVPWELLYPLTPTDDAGFLVEQFPVLRRVYDQPRSHRILLGEARYIVPPGSPANARDEVAAIRRVLHQPGNSTIADLAELLDLLDAGDLGLLHFACHNTFSLEAGGSSIKMGGGPFVPQLLNSAVARRRLAASRPLIFVNACRSAGVVAEYTRMMGWAEQFMAAGAGAFIGTLWPVRSTRASLFAEAFYAALVAGQDLGQASLAARRATKVDADPTWLAYTTYGDPTAVGTLAR